MRLLKSVLKHTTKKIIKYNYTFIKIIFKSTEKIKKIEYFFLFNKDNQAVLVDLGNGKYHIITKHDIIGSIK